MSNHATTIRTKKIEIVAVILIVLALAFLAAGIKQMKNTAGSADNTAAADRFAQTFSSCPALRTPEVIRLRNAIQDQGLAGISAADTTRIGDLKRACVSLTGIPGFSS